MKPGTVLLIWFQPFIVEYVLEIEGNLAANSRIIVSKQWSDINEESVTQDVESETSSRKTETEEEEDPEKNL